MLSINVCGKYPTTNASSTNVCAKEDIYRCVLFINIYSYDSTIDDDGRHVCVKNYISYMCYLQSSVVRMLL